MPCPASAGTLRDWVDLELLAHVARVRPDWHLILIGQELDDLSAIRVIANIHLLGQKAHDTLPAYCKGFDVGMIPYRIDELMTFVNPIKLREYLSAGLPVVSTPVPEVMRFAPSSTSRRRPATSLRRSIARSRKPEPKREQTARRPCETWAARVSQIAQSVDEMSERKSR